MLLAPSAGVEADVVGAAARPSSRSGRRKRARPPAQRPRRRPLRSRQRETHHPRLRPRSSPRRPLQLPPPKKRPPPPTTRARRPQPHPSLSLWHRRHRCLRRRRQRPCLSQRPSMARRRPQRVATDRTTHRARRLLRSPTGARLLRSTATTTRPPRCFRRTISRVSAPGGAAGGSASRHRRDNGFASCSEHGVGTRAISRDTRRP